MLDRKALKEIDLMTIGLAVVISLIGVIFVHSAIYYHASQFVWRQMVWLVLSLLVMLLSLLVDYKIMLTFSWAFYIFINLLLVVLLLFGKLVANTKSWFVFGSYQFQPSEIAKLAIILLLARIFSEYRDDLMSTRVFLVSSAVVGIPFILTAVQPDLGTALTYLPILLGAYILAGMKKKYVVIFLLAMILAGYVGWNYGLKDYQKRRVETLLFPGQDPRGAGYHLRQSKIAIGSGGLTGKGYHKGTQSQLRFLPARHTDFIISVIAEETGFIGILGLFIIYVLFLYRIFSTAWVAPDRAGVYICFLAGMLIAGQFLINIMMIVGLFPIAGIPVPFVSYGGSSLLANFLVVGLVVNVRMRRFAFI